MSQVFSPHLAGLARSHACRLVWGPDPMGGRSGKTSTEEDFPKPSGAMSERVWWIEKGMIDRIRHNKGENTTPIMR